jgi:hypothetical protein
MDIWRVDFGSDEASWVRYEDHSKYVVATDVEVICSSDINRDYTQRARGGMALCMNNAKNAKEILYNSIKDVNECHSA